MIDSQLEGPPSLKPKVKYSDLTGLKANYMDPSSGIFYANSMEYKYLKNNLTPAMISQLLEMRGVTNVIK